jgi:hypothetical protein
MGELSVRKECWDFSHVEWLALAESRGRVALSMTSINARRPRQCTGPESLVKNVQRDLEPA